MQKEDLQKIADLMNKRLEEKHEKYGDSWKTDNPIVLQNRMFAKIKSYRDNFLDVGVETLIDIANQAMLLALRLQPKKEQLWKVNYSDWAGNMRNVTVNKAGKDAIIEDKHNTEVCTEKM